MWVIAVELLLRMSLLLVMLNMLHLLNVWLTLMLNVLLWRLLRLLLNLLRILLLRYHGLGSGKNLRRLGKRIIVQELWKLLTQDPMNNFVSHAIMPDQGLPRVLGDIVAVLEGAVVWLIGDEGDVLEQLFLEVLVTHVLPEFISHSELNLTVGVGALDADL